ncbi:MAG TPA: O-antigen ligase family protein, partial [Verrucomicrobiae bacterium]|nr:O-antigen ligase family protein [Verrucomicrobiae bacterium]
PNALAGLILLLFPLSLVLIFRNTGSLRPLVRLPAMVVVLLLGGLALYWSGSKLGWLIVVALGGLCLFRLRWPARWKVTAATAIVLLGLAVFAVRFHSYFSAGATSVGARFDYWRAALQTTVAEPLVGTGPGTFQRPYQRLKSPTAEMARLTHNDYLEQFCDSGVPGGMFYAAWVAALLLFIVRKTWVAGDPMALAVMVGLLGWFGQGLGEFELYVPALAWTAFTLAGWALATAAKPVDKPGLPSKISAK